MMAHEFIKSLPSPQRPAAPSWDGTFEDREGRLLFLFGGESGGKTIPTLKSLNETHTFTDPLRSLPFLKTSKAVGQSRGVFFRRIQLRYLLCLAEGRLGMKLHIKYLWSLYQSALNG